MMAYTENKKIRPDILTKAVYGSYAIIMVYTIISHRITGNIGGYFISGPLTLYILFYLGLVQAVQKAVYIMVRARAKRSQFQNAETNMKRSMKIFGIGAVGTGVLVIALSYYISKYLFGSERNMFQTILVGICIMLFGTQGVIRGYLQGIGYSRPVFISDILISLVSFIPGIVAVIILHLYGDKVNGLFHTDLFSAVYGATGMTLGLVVGAAAGFIQALFSFRIRKNELSEFVKSSGPRYLDNKNDVLTGIRPVLVVYLIPALMILLDQIFYTIFTSKVHEDVDYLSDYGMFFGRIVVTIVMITLLCCIPFVGSWGRVMARIEREEYDFARKRMKSTVRDSNLLHIPVSVFVFVMAGTIQVALFGKSSAPADTLMMIAAPFIFFCCQALYLSWLLNHMGKSIVSIIGICVAFILHVIGIVVFVVVFNLSVRGVLISEVIAVSAYALLCFWLTSKMLRYRQEWIMSYMFPLVSSIIAGLSAFLLNRFLLNVIGEILTLIICMAVFWLVYMIAMVVSGGLLSNDLKRIPLGNLFIGISTALRH